jgi:hypothetical protein
VSDDGLRDRMLQLSPTTRGELRRVVILDQPDRDAIATELVRHRDADGDGWADVIDILTMYPDVRRDAVRCRVSGDRRDMNANADCELTRGRE